MNLTNRLIRKCRRLDVEQKQKYIELGRTCEESMKEQPEPETKETETKEPEPKQTIKIELSHSEAKPEAKPTKKAVKKTSDKPKKSKTDKTDTNSK
jgi:hypothetical protein